jgi:hypothetical protein
LAPDFDGKFKRSSESHSEMILSSSFDTKNYRSSLNHYRQLLSGGNLITVGPNCGGATLDFSQFMESCLGVTVQRTTTLTATFTATSTWSYGFTTMTVAGCTPVGFPYPNCQDIVVPFFQENTTDDYYNATSFTWIYSPTIPFSDLATENYSTIVADTTTESIIYTNID